jgi:hypothetical protein
MDARESACFLKVEVLNLEVADWGWSAIIPGFGLLADEFPEPETTVHVSAGVCGRHGREFFVVSWGETHASEEWTQEVADWGWSAIIPGFGLLADEFPEPEIKIWELNREAGLLSSRQSMFPPAFVGGTVESSSSLAGARPMHPRNAALPSKPRFALPSALSSSRTSPG